MGDTKRLITVEDVLNIRTVEDPRISPDGQWIAYVLVNANPDKKRYDRNIYLLSTAGGDPIQLTRSGKDSAPRWSPDSTKLAFVSSRSDGTSESSNNAKSQVYILPVATPGEPRRLTNHENGASAPAWSPDGEYIAYSARVSAEERAREDSGDEPEPPQDELESRQRSERKKQDEAARFDPRLIERIPFREGTTFNDERHAHIYVVRTAEGLDHDAAKPKRLTRASTSYDSIEWSKSGRHIVTTRAWNTDADEPHLYSNIYLIEFESGIERRIKDDSHRYYDPIPSHDGNWLVCTRSPFGGVDDLPRLTILPLEGGDAIDLNLELDRPVVFYDWTADDKLIVTVQTMGHYEIHLLDPQTKTFTPVVAEDQSIFNMNPGKDGSVAYVTRTATRLDELFYKSSGDAPVQMTHANTDFMNEIDVMETHEIRFKNKSGAEIQGWYILPPNYEPGKKYPLALNIHGGPRSMWAPGQHAMWHEWQCHAAEGYVVFYCNPRGTDGYGEAFVKALNSAWGSAAMEDIMAGVDLMIEKGFVDETRMALTGGSYGGYMTAWIIGQTQRFKAAVSQRGVYNLVSMYGTTDIPDFMRGWFKTEPWDNEPKMWEHSPLAYAHRVSTPTLLIHSENDFRVPIEQAEQLFAWIRRSTDTPVKLLRYPREGHELSRSGEPAHRISRLTEMINWFNQYCQPRN